ncbi:MAG: sugar ABC transporter substrate-binding protein [Candidatus Humimicrobiaceae bacterium]
MGISLSGCAADEEVVEEAEAVEEVEEETYAYYETLKEHAQDTDEPYPDNPAEGHTIAYTDIMGGIPFCNNVYDSVQKEWALAGGADNDLYYADNQYDATVGLQNADILLAKEPEVLIWFQFDSKVNSIVSKKYGDAGIPIIAVDVPVPEAPFMGVNNFEVAYMGGEEAIKRVEEQGGIDTIDKIILMQMPAGGEVVMLRSEGFYQAFVDEYGADVIDPMTIRADGGAGEAEQANSAMSDVLTSIPDAENFVLTSVNEQTMDGCISAVQTAGRWDPDKWIVITQGVDDVGKEQLREGLTDAGVAYFPERYGEYLIPAACAYLNGELPPPFMYVENEIITPENIDEYYPE